jgi:hypothetical protein
MKFRKKPVEIEAVKAGGRTAWRDLAEWCGGEVVRSADGRTVVGVVIHTLEGDMRAEPGDWIIQGVQGEFYPCKPDIFDATYEPVGATA